jgi:hypothetical protein
VRTTHVTYPRRADCPAHKTVDPVISLPEYAKSLTVGGLFAAIQDRVNGKAVLILPDKIVTVLYCSKCDVEEKVYRPYWQIVPGAVPCPTCETDRTFDVTTALAANHTTRDIPLAQAGIPALDILEIRAGQESLYVELSGDQVNVFAAWS